jgi:hypothetical protein
MFVSPLLARSRHAAADTTRPRGNPGIGRQADAGTTTSIPPGLTRLPALAGPPTRSCDCMSGRSFGYPDSPAPSETWGLRAETSGSPSVASGRTVFSCGPPGSRTLHLGIKSVSSTVRRLPRCHRPYRLSWAFVPHRPRRSRRVTSGRWDDGWDRWRHRVHAGHPRSGRGIDRRRERGGGGRRLRPPSGHRSGAPRRNRRPARVRTRRLSSTRSCPPATR